jgi:hypothetical protein
VDEDKDKKKKKKHKKKNVETPEGKPIFLTVFLIILFV